MCDKVNKSPCKLQKPFGECEWILFDNRLLYRSTTTAGECKNMRPTRAYFIPLPIERGILACITVSRVCARNTRASITTHSENSKPPSAPTRPKETVIREMFSRKDLEVSLAKGYPDRISFAVPWRMVSAHARYIEG